MPKKISQAFLYSSPKEKPMKNEQKEEPTRRRVDTNHTILCYSCFNIDGILFCVLLIYLF